MSRRVVVVVLALAALILGPAAPALAHDVGGVGATNFHTTLTALNPAVPGLSLTVVENGSRLELRNTTTADVIVLGYGGEPYARIGPAGVFLNDNSPATYLNASRFSTTAVPASVDPSKPPAWRQVAADPVYAWHDHRIHWMLSTLPPVVAADPGSQHTISDWTVELAYGGRSITADGTLEWLPGPSPWPWFVLMAVFAASLAVIGLLRRPHRILAGAAATVVLAAIVHGVGAMVVVTGSIAQKLGALFGGEALLFWPFAVLGAWLLWQRHTRALWIAGAAGLAMATTAFLDDAPLWWRATAPTALPLTFNRLLLAIVVAGGVGLALALPLMMRRHRPPSRPWVAPTDDAVSTPAPHPEPSGPSGPSEPSELEPGSDPAVPAVPVGVSRREIAGALAAGALGALAGAAAGSTFATSTPATPPPSGPGLGEVGARRIAYDGAHQPGIVAPGRPQSRAWIAAFDLVPGVNSAALSGLLKQWSGAARSLMAGEPLGRGDDAVIAGLGPSALTVTIGFGPSLFGKAGVPARARPAALAPLPTFRGELLDPVRSDGDLGVVVAADDPVVVAHAARVLRRLGAGIVTVRWQMTGFNPARGAGSDTATPRNLMGQIDGSNNPKPEDPDFTAKVFVGDAASPAWLRGGSFLVVRRIRMLLDPWERLAPTQQEAVIGRRRDNGAPLSGGTEFTPANYGAKSDAGELVIPANAHIRLATPAFNEGAAMLRRGFSYTDGDESGLLFLAWQADPRRGFIPVQRRLVASDALGAFIRHETSALFAMPGGTSAGHYVGQALVEG